MPQSSAFREPKQSPKGRDVSADRAAAIWQSAFSRDEMNLAEFPLAVLSTRANPKVKTLEFSDNVRGPGGELVERKWIITGADKFGLPTATDDDVVLGLMRISMANGFRERKVYFTRYELLKTLRWSTEGRSYSRLVKSLDRLSGVRIRSTNSFYDNSTKSYQTVNFGLIDSYEINDCRRGPGETEQKSFFVWSEQLFESFKAGYIKKLDLELYFQLRSAVSRRLYRYLDKHFYYKNVVERSLMQFAFEKIGLSRSYKYVSSIKQQLEPALEELVAIGFLNKYEIHGRGTGAVIRFVAGRGGESYQNPAMLNTQVPSHTPGTQAMAMQGSATQVQSTQAFTTQANGFSSRNAEHNTEPGLQPLAEKLIQRGMASPQARRLVGQIPRAKHERINKIIAYYDTLVEKNDYKVSKNKVGFLYRAVERSDEFSLPEELQAQAQEAVRSRRADLKVFKSSRARSARGRSTQRHTSGHTSEADQPLEVSANASQESTAQQGANSQRASTPRAASPQATPAQLAKAMAAVSPEELAAVYARVEEKMRCFKAILDQERYQEAIDGCVREEFLKRVNSDT